jgi:hypothetical protein
VDILLLWNPDVWFVNIYLFKKKFLGDEMKKLLAVLLIMLTTTIFLWQCAPERTEPLSSKMKNVIETFPDSSIGMGYINIEAMQESPFFSMMEKNWHKSPMHSEEYQEFMDATGLDIRKDINQIYFSLIPGAIEEKPEFLTLVMGKFDPEKITDYLLSKDEDKEITEQTFEGYKIFLLDEDHVSFSIVDNNRMIAGSPHLIENWLDGLKQEKQGKINRAMLERINSLKYKNDAWFTLNTEPMIGKMLDELDERGEGERLAGLKSVQNLNFSMQVNDEMKFSGIGNFSDEEKAKLFHDALKGFVATAKLSLSEDRDAVDVLNKIDIDTKGDQVMVNFKMSKSDVEKLLEKRRRIASR